MSGIEIIEAGIVDRQCYPATRYSINIDGNIAGRLDITTAAETVDYYANIQKLNSYSPIQPDDMWLSYIQLEDGLNGYRNKGFGRIIYSHIGDLAARNGLRFRTDPDCLTPDSMRVWRSLERHGNATQELPFWIDEDGDFQGGVMFYNSDVNI